MPLSILDIAQNSLATADAESQAGQGRRSVPRIAAPAQVPALQAPIYTPDAAPRLESSPGVSRLTGPASPSQVPARQAPWYTPESTSRLAAPQSIADVAADAGRAAPPAGPLERAAGAGSRIAPMAGAAGLLAGGAAATGVAAGTVASNPEYFRSSIGDDGLAANIMTAGQAPQTIADVARNQPTTARTQNGPLSVPVIAQMASGDSTAGTGRGSINPPNVQPSAIAALATMPKYDDTYRAANLRNMQNEAVREGDPIGDIIRQRTGQATDITQPPSNGGGYFLQAGAPAAPVGQFGEQPQAANGSPKQPAQNLISSIAFGGGGSKIYYKDGTAADLDASKPLPADAQQFMQLSARAAEQAQNQPVQIIKGGVQTVAVPTNNGPMREVPKEVFDAGQVQQYFAAQAQAQMNAANPLAAKTEAELAKVREENKGRLAVAETQNQAGKVPAGYRMAPDGRSMEKVPGGPADIGKALPSPAVKELSGAGASVETTQRLANTFQDQFGGKVVLGDLRNKMGRIFGDDTGQSQWWQDMDMQQNQARNALFGSALTKSELDAWEKTSVNPNMDPKEIRKNLGLRADIEARAASKLARSYTAAGYNKEQIGELLGSAAQYLDKPAPPAGPAPKGGAAASGQAGAPNAPKASPSDAHIAALKANPTRRKEFESKFGAGSAASILGE